MFRNYIHDPKDPSDKHSFELHELDLSIANGLRRVILTDIPIPGIIGEEEPTIDIIINTCALHNEYIIHRIGLIPICFSEEDTENYEDNSIELELNVKNDENKMQNVDTSMITAKRNGIELNKQELAKLFPPNNITKDYILITRLKTNEHLHFKAKIVKKTARFNASFSPVSLCNFSYIQDPTKAAEKDNILDKERSYYKNNYGDPNALLFEIETINKNLEPKYLINKAIEIIINKLNRLRDNLTLETSNDVKVERFQTLENTYEFHINEEDDTLGNIIQSILHNKYVREKKPLFNDIVCSYVGYICPHPLKYLLIIRITLENQTNKQTFIQFLESNCRMIIDELLEIKSNWNKFIL